jgi:hypothetical protein
MLNITLQHRPGPQSHPDPSDTQPSAPGLREMIDALRALPRDEDQDTEMTDEVNDTASVATSVPFLFAGSITDSESVKTTDTGSETGSESTIRGKKPDAESSSDAQSLRDDESISHVSETTVSQYFQMNQYTGTVHTTAIRQAAASSARKPVDPNRDSKRQMETTMKKCELRHIRAWYNPDNRPTYLGAPEDTICKVPIYLHEAYHLRAHRKSKGVTLNRIPKLAAKVVDKEWLLEAIVVGDKYLNDCKSGIEAMENGLEKDYLLERMEVSEQWADEVKRDNEKHLDS